MLLTERSESEAVMTTAISTGTRPSRRQMPIPRTVRQKVEPLLEESYAFMDSPIFKQRDIEKQLFTFDVEPQLPLTAWYQPTRDEAVDESIAGAPQLMKAAEERLMFLRFNYAKLRLSRLQKLIKKDGL